MTRNRFWKLLLLAQGSLLVSAGASAEIVELDFNVSYGAVEADGGAPWITATIADGADAPGVPLGSVLLTISASAGLGEADVTQLYFNFLPGDPDNLTFDADHVSADVSAVDNFTVLQEAADSYRAGGDGYFDFRIDLPTENTGGDRLTAGESISFVISYSQALSPQDFFDLSLAGTGEDNAGPFYAAAHIQST
ncbi:MAG TPA: hypothetical protein VKQ06_07770, partial [Gammaproteobacteria bacterium]|nr:hypothetical protein [Gammaproteobacteria bacterium]